MEPLLAVSDNTQCLTSPSCPQALSQGLVTSKPGACVLVASFLFSLTIQIVQFEYSRMVPGIWTSHNPSPPPRLSDSAVAVGTFTCRARGE